MAWGVPPPGGGGKRGKTTKVFFPLLTPQTFLRTRLPSVARLNARGPQGRLLLQEHTLDRSGAFRRTRRTPCTGWPRTVMRGKLRKLTSGHNSLPKPARRTEPSPRNPRFAAQPKGVAAQRRVWGSQEGAREPYGALAPFCPGRRRRPLSTLTSSVKSPPAEAIPSADGIEIKSPCSLGELQGPILFRGSSTHTLLRREGKNRSSNRKQLMNLCPPLAYDATRFGRK